MINSIFNPLTTSSGGFSAESSSSNIKIEDQIYERYFLSDVKEELFTNNDHHLNNDSEDIDGS